MYKKYLLGVIFINGKKIFFISFVASFLLMLAAYLALYWTMDITPHEINAKKSGIPIQKAGIDDSKTVLLCIQADKTEFFFLLKFNALQNKVNISCLSSQLMLKKADRTIDASYKYAGIMQCVYDIKNEYDIAVDYYAVCSEDTMAKIIASFKGFDVREVSDKLPQPIKSLLTKGAEHLDANSLVNIIKGTGGLLDNNTGLTFLNECAYLLVKYNLENIAKYGLKDFKDNFSSINTNINAQALDKLNGIIELLLRNEVVYERDVITDSQIAGEQLDKLLKE